MLFFLSKILLFLIKPFFWFLALLSLSLFAKEKKRKQRFLVWAVIVLLFFSNGFIAGRFINLYEPNYPKDKKNYDVTIVLGGFSSLNKRNNEIQFNWANDRLFQTISLYQKGRVKKILIAGGNANLIDNKVKEADLAEDFLHSICIPDTDIMIENQSRNTIENAQFSSILINRTMPSAKILVVTSAWHIPRAKLIFNKTFKKELDYLPTNYIGSPDYGIQDFIIPDPGALGAWELLFKEWIGLVVARIRS